MYRVLIVDDEPLVRIGLKSMVDWEKLGFEVIAEAANGEIAYEKYLALHPDVLITDIKMPKKDGLWLIKKVREDNAKIPVIVLTSHDDFEYARQALHLQVSNYLLKTEMEDKQIAAVLSEIKKGLSPEPRIQTKEITAVHHDSLVALFFDDKLAPSDIKDKLSEVFPNYFTHVICIIQFDFSVSLLNERYDGQKTEQILTAAKEVIKNRLEANKFFAAIKQFKKSLTCFICAPQLNHASLLQILEELNDTVHRYFTIHFASAALEPSAAVEDILPQINALLKISDFMFYAEECDYIFSDAALFGDKPSYTQSQRRELASNLLTAAEHLDFSQKELLFSKIVHTLKNSHLGSVEGKLELVHIIDDAMKLCQSFMDTHAIEISKYQKLILNADHMKDAIVYISQFLDELAKYFGEVKIDNAGAAVQKAKDYININFAQNFSLEDVANHVGISKYYFSNVFKKVNGDSFSTYLNLVRIEQAKLLLKDRKKTVAQVSEAVGYSDQQYFSKMFKKLTGKTVSEYRCDV